MRPTLISQRVVQLFAKPGPKTFIDTNDLRKLVPQVNGIECLRKGHVRRRKVPRSLRHRAHDGALQVVLYPRKSLDKRALMSAEYIYGELSGQERTIPGFENAGQHVERIEEPHGSPQGGSRFVGSEQRLMMKGYNSVDIDRAQWA